jgi:phosphoglucosamine mutase
MSLFGTSGIRAVVDSWLIQLALKVGLVVGMGKNNVVVGCDTRTSSGAMKQAVIAGLLAAGSNCYDAGVVPTPTLALAAKEFNAGVMITASHNPPQYNGIKLLNPDGSAFDKKQQESIEEIISDNSINTAPWQRFQSVKNYPDAIRKHIDSILTFFPEKYKIKVVLDCDCGAGSVITPELLKMMGCEVIELNCEQSGYFPHDIEPTEKNLTNLMEVVRESGADLGIAHDGDADRMMAIDDRGRFIDGDKLLADYVITIPAVDYIFTPVVNVVAMQLLAYYAARERGCPIDFPRNLAKSVTVE